MCKTFNCAILRLVFHISTHLIINYELNELKSYFCFGTRGLLYIGTRVSGWASLSFVSNISCLVELADILHFHNCNKHNSRLAVVLKRSCNFHIRKNIGKRLSALFLPFCVRSWGK